MESTRVTHLNIDHMEEFMRNHLVTISFPLATAVTANGPGRKWATKLLAMMLAIAMPSAFAQVSDTTVAVEGGKI
jgi:hypothetical protein